MNRLLNEIGTTARNIEIVVMKLIKKGAITLVVVACRKGGDGRNWCTSLSRRDFAVHYMRSGDVARLPPVASKWKVCGSGAWWSYVRRG